MADQETLSNNAKDEIADIVIQRYRRSRDYRGQHLVHQYTSFDTLLSRAYHQYRREYTTEDAAAMEDAFGFVPTRYYGVTQQKVNATVAWNSDLVINNLDAMFTATPSPEPQLDKASIERIREQIRADLVRTMVANGIADPTMLLNARGQTHSRIENYIRDQIKDLKKIEQARIVSVASEAAQRAQRRMRDLTIQGNFRVAYMSYTFERMLVGTGVMCFPDWQQRAVLEHSGRKAKMVWKTVPWFRHVKLDDFYPICDAIDYQTNTGNTEVTYVNKSELISMARKDDYNEREIEQILEDFAYRSRNWIEASNFESRDEWWELDDTIPLLVHEGFFSGDELAEHGVTGYDTLEYVSARVEICGSRTIRCSVRRMPGGADRSYFGAPFTKIGDNLLDNIGLAQMLWDSEQRVNRIMHIFEHNLDWASRPALIKNRHVFDNPMDAGNIRPGGQYGVEDRWATSASMPEPIRPMHAVTAQYHLILTQVGAILRQADEDCGIPAFAYGAQDFGRSSLGEYSQRMSNALRTIKQAALYEDIYLIEPAFTGLFHHEMQTDEDIAEGQDVGLVVRGMTGLLKEDQQAKNSQAITPAVLQLSNQRPDLVPEQAVQYAVRQLLEQAGFPVDALGIGNPVIDQALAVAANTPLPNATPGGPQVPQLDGRSGVPAANVASPTGASQLSIPGPTL